MIGFHNILGHPGPIDILKRHLAGSSGAHALLFEGPSGIGKRLTALTAVATHLCQNPGEDGACMSCPSCRQMTAGSHFGLWLIDPDLSKGDRDPEDPEPVEGLRPRLFEDSSASGKIGIDPIRSLKEELSLKPSDDPRRGIVLADFDEATLEAQNAVLKTLEEPPDQTLLICTASSREGLTDTIVSRCQRIRFQPLTTDQVLSILDEKTDVDPDQREFLARISGGRPGLALRFSTDEFLEKRNAFIEAVKEYGGPSDPRFRNEAEEVFGTGSDAVIGQSPFSEYLLFHRALLQDVLYRKVAFNDQESTHFPEEVVEQAADNMDIQQIIDAAERLETLDRADDLHINKKVLIENLPV